LNFQTIKSRKFALVTCFFNAGQGVGLNGGWCPLVNREEKRWREDVIAIQIWGYG
jgi:hypothetical protein